MGTPIRIVRMVGAPVLVVAGGQTGNGKRNRRSFDFAQDDKVLGGWVSVQ
jgi:hypothetical protein